MASFISSLLARVNAVTL